MKRRRIIALVFAIVMTMSILTGCQGKKEEATTTEETELTVWYWGEQEIPGYQKYMEEMAVKYAEENPGITVEVVLQDSDTLYSALRTAEAAGAGPDCAFLWGGTQALEDVWLGNLDPISDYMSEEELGIIDSNALAESNWNGKQWGWPAYSVCFGIAYNKQMFNDAGLDGENPPKTWDEFINACEKLKVAGYTPIGSGVKDGYLPGWLAVYFAAQNYDDPNDAIKPFRLEADYTADQYSEWVYKVAELVEAGYFNDDVLSLDLYQGQQLLETENCAMTFQCGPYTQTIANTMGEDKIGFMQAPVFGEGELAKAVTVGQQVYVLPKSAKHKEQVCDFFLFLAREDNIAKMVEYTNAWVPTKTFNPATINGEVIQNVATWMVNQRVYDYQYTYPMNWENESLMPIMQKLFAGELAAADVVTQLSDGIAKWAEQNPTVLDAYKIWEVK